MKIILTKKIQLKTAIVYLKLEKDKERKDIQDYLNGKAFNDIQIENRVKEYLKNIKVYDEKYQLTTLGYKVKETGMLATREEGKYLIWFTQNDSHFGNKIFHFKRISPLRFENGGKLNLRLEENSHYYLPSENQIYSNFNLLPIDHYFGEINKNTDYLSLRWSWKNTDESTYLFEGELITVNDKISINSNNIPCKENLNLLIEEIQPQWNSKQKRYKIHFDEVQAESKIKFEDDYKGRWKDFDFQIQNRPLMPYSLEDAKKWRNWLLIEKLKKEYLNPSNFKSIAIETNEMNGFAYFKADLDIPTSLSFNKEVVKETVAFWHLNAPINLNP